MFVYFGVGWLGLVWGQMQLGVSLGASLVLGIRCSLGSIWGLGSDAVGGQFVVRSDVVGVTLRLGVTCVCMCLRLVGRSQLGVKCSWSSVCGGVGCSLGLGARGRVRFGVGGRGVG